MQNTEQILEQLSGVSLLIENRKIFVLDILKTIPRSGKSVRLKKHGLSLPPRSIYDHIVSLHLQARFFLPLLKIDMDSELLECMFLFHDLSEAVIGDAPSFTSREMAMDTYMCQHKKNVEEAKINQLILEALPENLKYTFELYLKHHHEKNSSIYQFFNMIDKTDPIIAIWRYLFLFQQKMEIDHFLNAMADFFLNPEPQQICMDLKTRSLIGALQNTDLAKKYFLNPVNFFQNHFEEDVAADLQQLIESRQMHFVEH